MEDFFDSITMEQATPFAIIEIPHIFKKNSLFPLPLISAKQFQIMEDLVYIDITKKEFYRMFKLYQAERKLRIKSAKLAKVSAQDAAIAKIAWSRV
ncbi:MAG: hypothetical protein FK733_09570 [Asgard group archaeon]|nr:hypothetical protein [Asgard group archaeon]